MSSNIPDWPAHGAKNWDAPVIARTDAAFLHSEETSSRLPLDAGGNVGPANGSALTIWDTDGTKQYKLTVHAGTLTVTEVTSSTPLPGTDPIPGADPENIPDTVTIGANVLALDGINTDRGEDQLILYTAATLSPTQTNMYGVEVVVRKSDGHVVRVNDRITASNTAGTTFDPATEYVLSGWGTGASYAGDWLRAHATVGVTVVLSSDATPDPTPPATSNPSSKQVVVFHHGFSGPRLYTGYPTAVKAAVDRIIIIPAQSAAPGTGLLQFPGTASAGTGTNLQNDVTAAKAAGVDVTMGIGGSADGGITLLNNNQGDQAIASINGFVTSYGINGITYDLEDVSRWNVATLKYIAQALKTKYGNGFLVDVCAGYYSPQSIQYNALAQSLGSLMDTFSLMEYDYPQASQAGYGNLVADKVGQVVAAGVPVTKIIFGQAVTDPANPGYAGYTSSVSAALTAYQTVKTRYPTIGGAFIWEDKISAARASAWDWVLGMAATIHA